jgi:hypothetical protein
LMSPHPGRVKAELDSRDADPARIHEMLFESEINEAAENV